jgi:membrane associated rhomboid family serine protease
MQVEELAARHREARAVELRHPETPFEWFGWLFGLPIADSGPLSRQPIMTYLTAAALVVCGVLAATFGGAIEAFGLVPAELGRANGLTFFTSFFIHADPVHLIVNTYFLLLVGEGSENLLGHARFVLLLATATLAGGVAHVLVDPSSTVPCVGASGGISGIMVFFALKLPRARISVFFWALRISVPALFAILLWFGMQLFTLAGQLEGLSNVSAAAHFGGALVGVAFWLLYRKL